ncbi:MAG: RecQ family ATP-dependent DNA helicase [Bacteroidales bacterium]|nr:RecQ family ATP-dependent DNA helicase [Bacteroidales bacterium]MBN2818746.1 RecQ family ATP-dependent DNA helicase [Bacteroidales bacterium]
MNKTLPEYIEILKKIWGYSSFRPAQEKILLSIANGKDTLGLLPTGGGKSLTFQVPAIAAEGTCLVVTPLIALMIDQVDRLKTLGVKAAAVHSGIGKHEMQIILDNALYGAYKLLYVSPERLDNADFKIRLQHMKISFVAIDEAHCISQWGYDFRPSYLKIANIRELLPGVPFLALTATATTDVVKDIQLKLKFKEENVIQTDFSRSNLVYFVRQSESKMVDLIKVVKSLRGTGIVYTRSRRKTKEIADYLRQEKISVDYFHAGLNFDLKKAKQERWTQDKTRVIVATNAFGMGIDKPDVRFVIHVDMPDSIEEYFQEAGRAGRDGKKSFAVLISGSIDKQILKKRLTDSFPEIEFVKKVYKGICNYLQVPIGGGKGIAFEFDLHQFVAAYKFHPVQTYNALKILEQQGYIELTDEMLNPSRVFFSVNRDDLYKFQVENIQFDAFVKLVLRSYTGLFSEYVTVREEVLAKRSGLTRDLVYQYFVRLAKMNIIKYIPGKRSSLLVFTEERLGDRSIYISPENFHHKKERYELRLEAVENYAFSNEKCREIALLEYFGQKKEEECGHCDYCRDKSIRFTDEEKKLIREYILEKLTNSPLSPENLVHGSPFHTEHFSFVVRMLLDDEKIRYNSKGEIFISET